MIKNLFPLIGVISLVVSGVAGASYSQDCSTPRINHPNPLLTRGRATYNSDFLSCCRSRVRSSFGGMAPTPVKKRFCHHRHSEANPDAQHTNEYCAL